MGGPPMGMYGQPGQLQADAALAAVEAKQKAREEKEKMKEVEHMAHMVRAGNRSNEETKSFASMLIFWGVMNTLLWAAPLLGDSWWHKTWNGLSINKLTIGVGLWNMEIDLECSSTAANEMCKSIKKYTDHNDGHWTITDIDKEMCTNLKAACPMMDRLYEAGFFPLYMLPVSAASEVLGTLLLYLYWHGMPTATMRTLANKSSALALLSGVTAFVAWLVWSPYLQELPRMWIAEATGSKDAANGALFGLKESFMFPMGWCSIVLLMTTISSGMRFFCQFALPCHMDEPELCGLGENAKLMAEAEKMYNGDHRP